MSVELPKDAEGCEIPLDTTAMYEADGKVVNISRWIYCTALGFLDDFRRGWCAMGSGDRLVSTVSLYLTPPDSWEKLEEDLGRGADSRPCAEALPPKRRDAQARGEVQVMARTGLRIEACRHIFKRPGVPYGN